MQTTSGPYWRLGLTLLCLGVGFTACKHSQSESTATLASKDSKQSGSRPSPARLTPVDQAVEAATTAGLIAAIKRTVSGARDAHPKAHGCFDDLTLSVDANLPANYRNDLFQPGRNYQAAVRLSHGSASPKAIDMIKDVHGFALKIFLDNHFEREDPIKADLPLVNPDTGELLGMVEVNELRLTEGQGVGEKYYHTVDIIGINALDEFMVDRLADYRDFFMTGAVLREVIPYILNPENEAALPTTHSNPELNPALAAIAPAVTQGRLYKNFKDGVLPPDQVPNLIVEIKDAVFAVLFNQSRGGEQGEVAELVRKANANQTWDVLKSSYQSFVPYRYGSDAAAHEGFAAKYQIEAIDCASKQRVSFDNAEAPPTYVQSHLIGSQPENFLSSVLKQQVQRKDHCFALKAQLWQQGYPSLDSAKGVWGDRQYTRIGELRIPQNAPVMDTNKCEMLSFNPGHGPAEYQGAGEIQRARRLIYAAIETLRNEQRLGLQN